MLEIEKFVPGVYVKKSRDFQMYCKALEIIANNVKFNADTITDIYNPDKVNNRMLELLATLYNYKPIRNLSDNDLRLILSNYQYLIKHKGTRKGIEAAISLVMKLTRKDLQWSYSIITKDTEGKPVYKIYINVNGEYDRAFMHEFLDKVTPVGYIVEDTISTPSTYSSKATVKMIVNEDVEQADIIGKVVKLDEAEKTKARIERTEVIKVTE